jgi:hypothetical protein
VQKGLLCFAHEDGLGSNLLLQGLPRHGNAKLVVRAYEPEKVIEGQADAAE